MIIRKQDQVKLHEECVRKIMESSARLKVIVSGPGTGKSAVIKQLLKNAKGERLALTFIRKLADDTHNDIKDFAESKTFHAFCKKVLHQQNGKVDFVPYLTKIVERDARLLGRPSANFDKLFRELSGEVDAINFYLTRGDYYEKVGFDDAVFRLYKALQSNPRVIPDFGLVVIDEYQDFNALEVAFLNEIEKKAPVVIVGDDDQAVYEMRSSSPHFLREKYAAAGEAKFTLPFCRRSTHAIVEATNSIIADATKRGLLKGRIEKPFKCYLEAKESDNAKYPKIVMAEFKTAVSYPKYILQEIERIDFAEIKESHARNYPTVLIIGSKQYLREIEPKLRAVYSQVIYTKPREDGHTIAHGYELILLDSDSNLGWRIVIEHLLDVSQERKIIAAAVGKKKIVDFLPKDFVAAQRGIVASLGVLRSDDDPKPDMKGLKKALGSEAEAIISHFTPKNEEVVEPDISQPTILMTSFEGCKGLSSAHTFIVGAHNGAIPRDISHIGDREISQFVVALTRTRKQCHVLSNQWLNNPRQADGSWNQKFSPSIFLSWIPKNIILDKGLMSAADFPAKKKARKK